MPFVIFTQVTLLITQVILLIKCYSRGMGEFRSTIKEKQTIE